MPFAALLAVFASALKAKTLGFLPSPSVYGGIFFFTMPVQPLTGTWAQLGGKMLAFGGK